MDRPKATPHKPREVTGEIAYLDAMRKAGEHGEAYAKLSDMAIQMYEATANTYRTQGLRPEILEEYEKYDAEEPTIDRDIVAFADALLEYKEIPDLTFQDFVVDVPPAEVLDRLMAMPAGQMLTSQDAQLAIPSNGEYYPVLDVKKRDMELVDVNIRVWGRDYPKVVFTNGDEPYEYPKHVLAYPSDEPESLREITLNFSYIHPEAGHVIEKATLTNYGHCSMNGDIWMSAYAETGYEGHGDETRVGTEQDAVAFMEFIAELLGDEPTTVQTRQRENLSYIYRQLIKIDVPVELLDRWMAASWPAQILYELTRCPYEELEGKSMVYGLSHETLRPVAMQLLEARVAEYDMRESYE